MGLWAEAATGTRRSTCYHCNKTLEGKGQEFFFRVSHNGCGKNYCAPCLRKFADELDKLNTKHEQPGDNRTSSS